MQKKESELMAKAMAGINHIEFWVSDLQRSMKFYAPIFEATGWHKLSETEFSSSTCVLYFVEKAVKRSDAIGPRHLCLQAGSREMVESVAELLKKQKAEVLRGPIEMPEYSPGYYTVDARDPDGYVIEVAYTPSMAM
jgi:catechol 2,3-dioxygenase-like lactoylglutathione lyase family enzyme